MGQVQAASLFLLSMSQQLLLPPPAGVGLVHAAFRGKETELAPAVQCPLIVLPAKTDTMETIKEVRRP